jgi:hypothetical protein
MVMAVGVNTLGQASRSPGQTSGRSSAPERLAHCGHANRTDGMWAGIVSGHGGEMSQITLWEAKNPLLFRRLHNILVAFPSLQSAPSVSMREI